MPAEEEAILDYRQIWLSPCAAGAGAFSLHKVGLPGNRVVFQEVFEDVQGEEDADY